MQYVRKELTLMPKNIYVLEIIMLEEASVDKNISNDIGELIGHIEDKGYLLQTREGIASAIDATIDDSM